MACDGCARRSAEMQAAINEHQSWLGKLGGVARLVSTTEFWFGTKRLQVGDEFEVDAAQADSLIASGMAAEQAPNSPNSP